MKKITRLIHKGVILIGIDDLIANYAYKVPFIWRLIPSHLEYDKSVVKRVKRGNSFFELNIGDYMQWHVYASIPEPLWLTARRLLPENAVVFDIGANIGAFSLKIASWLNQKKRDYQVHSFEPNPDIINCFERNLELNPELISSISLIPKALSDQNAILFFDANRINSGAGRITNSEEGIQVEAITLDNYCQQYKICQVDLIKIDVEGNEPKVLIGGQKTIEKHKPVLILEITDSWFKSIESSAADIFYYLECLEYKFISDIGGKVKPFNYNDDQDRPFQYNVLAIYSEN